MHIQGVAPDDWWPEWLHDLAHDDPMALALVPVAFIEPTESAHARYHQAFTGLVPMEALEAVLNSPGGIGFEVSAVGPYAEAPGSKVINGPRFHIMAGDALPEGLEPLVLSWRAGNQTVLSPDPGFLMTYGLMPRVAGSPAPPTIHWDDVETPKGDIVIVEPLSKYEFPTHTGASIRVARDFLQDYSTIRNRALVQVYYAQRIGPTSEEIDRMLSGRPIADFPLPGRLLDIRAVDDSGETVLIQVWGVRLLVTPGASPISAGRWDYGALDWPGYSGPMTDKRAHGLGSMDVVYVRDTVLGAYEGRAEFSISPETGSVSYGNQWSVSWSRRVGRDLIAVELKKLYEANRPDTVRHWHAHALSPTPSTPSGSAPNVGSRARRLVYAIARLGDALSIISSGASLTTTASEFVGFDAADLDYYGWWGATAVEPITRHILLGITREVFLDRASKLHQLVVESLSEAKLRALLLALNTPKDQIKDFRSLRLLDYLVRLVDASQASGLEITNPSIHDRVDVTEPSSLAALFALNDLRQLSDHQTGASSQARFEKALEAFALHSSDYATGWGLALDALYDHLADALELVAS